MERILLLEDDKSLVTGLTLALGRAGYALDTARTLAEANRLWQAGRYDLLMLDVTLPDGTVLTEAASPAETASPSWGRLTKTMSPSSLWAKSVMPTRAVVSSSILTHSWSREYFSSAGKFMICSSNSVLWG